MLHVAEPTLPLGATYLGDGRCRFHLWAPHAQRVDLVLTGEGGRVVAMQPRGDGYYHLVVEGVKPGATYLYRLDGGQERPDPASRYQPEGVHRASAVIDPDFAWTDHGWHGLPLQRYILYELHIGTFTPEGTFDAIIPRLDSLQELGITAIELMPVAQFPGSRNWGYDGVHPFAVQNSYGGPDGYRRLVDACHARGLAVVQDVVYNHLGPEGNYLSQFGPYFTSRHKTVWGDAVNFDGPDSDEVRRFFIDNAIYFLRDLHVDALRLDAVDAILDFSATPFLEELAAVVDQAAVLLNRQLWLMAETAQNDARWITPREMRGYGLHAQWNDEFHHAIHTLLTGEQRGYYIDYVEPDGAVRAANLAKALAGGYVYSGQYSRYRRRRHGNSSRAVPPYRFVVCIQNHDQVGNRMVGDRLSALVSWDQLKLAAGVLLLAPNLPLLFMGEEYADPNPFLYFVSHGDADLVAAVRAGRAEEFRHFHHEGLPPDPQAEETFRRSTLAYELRREDRHQELCAFYRELIRLRKALAPLRHLSKEHMEVQAFEETRTVAMRRWYADEEVLAVFNFSAEPATVTLALPEGHWTQLLDSTGTRAGSQELEQPAEIGVPAPPHGFALYWLEGSARG
ncbi:MAG: malto-oligosyltrehalose trehalohydrolase [Caldilineaceae bacterium]|nr:malto-oligosyltrehalose trehalohydrolase [Caldilineaceae bacterium]